MFSVHLPTEGMPNTSWAKPDGNPTGRGDADVLEKLGNKRGEGYIDVAVLVFCAMLVLALAVKLFPVYIARANLTSLPRNFAEKQRLQAGSAAKPACRRRC